ncbi:hypothetical protein ACFL21_04590 [Patescibacteria group bacterium]
MKIKKNLIFCYAMLIISFCFWLAVAIFSVYTQTAKTDYHLLIAILLFIEPLVFAIIFFGILTRNKVIFFLSMPFLIINAILSISDELGVMDLTAAALNIITLISIISICGIINKGKGPIEYLFKQKIDSP